MTTQASDPKNLIEKLYPVQNPTALEPFYSRHVWAMTNENLESKSDIAAQLAWRDAKITHLLSKKVDLDALMRRIEDAVNDALEYYEYYDSEVALPAIRTVLEESLA